MLIQRISNFADLQPYHQRWDCLAGDCVFRSWTWISAWWQHYGSDHQPYVLLVFADEQEGLRCRSAAACADVAPDADNLLAIFPCYLDTCFARGRVLRLLGDGEVCSDHLDLLVDSADLEAVAKELSRYLVDHADEWDSTDFTAVGADCRGLMQLSDELAALDCHTTHKPNENRWAVPLPHDWEAFLAMQSKSHRKQLRQLTRRVLETEQAVWHLVETPTDFEAAWPILVDLHQRRRISLGEPGCFASQRWADFHQDVARQLLDQGKLRLSWLDMAGQPVAAEYHFAGKQSTWAYQGGVDPDRIREEPGRLSMIRTFQHAIAEGHRSFDFLRGDEPYKAHWRAEPIETFDIQIVPARNAARWRSQACNYFHGAIRMARQLTNMLG